MPRVKQIKMCLGLNPATEDELTVVNIEYYNGRDEPENGRFYVKLPQVLADALGQKLAEGKTQHAAFEAFETCLKRFKSLKTERHRVILYDIHVEPHPKHDSRYHDPSGLEVKIWAAAYEEIISISGAGDRRYNYEPRESSLKYYGVPFEVRHSRQERIADQVPWTEKNEAFFKWIEDQLNALIYALADIAEPAKMIETINAGRLLPLGGQQKEAK